jgi:uroporphyrin-III C-methyltransferase
LNIMLRRTSHSRSEVVGPRVYLVGAGPGDPDLLTLKAARLLQQADVVLHDALIDPRALALASNARLIDVGKRASKASTAQRFINRMLVTSALHYRCVVRLKGGDPTIFGRLDEEMAALREAGIPFEVVPGVTAACAAAAGLQASLTLRGVARSVRFLTPRVATDQGRIELPQPAAAGADEDSLVVYMAGELLVDCAQRLMASGRPSSTPLLAVENASLPNEQRWAGTLGTAQAWPGPREGGPVLLLIGQAFARVSNELQAQHCRDLAPLAVAVAA